MTLLLVGAGGFFGGDLPLPRRRLGIRRDWRRIPVVTLVVNVTGSFVLGLLFAASVERGVLPAEDYLGSVLGFIGAYTTFSTLTLESWRLVENGSYIAPAVGNIGGSMLLGLVAVVARACCLGRPLA